MIKKTFIYLMLTLFTTAVAAEELFMKCDAFTYKYIQDPAGDKVFWKHKKWSKNKYKEWCAEALTEGDIKDGILAREGWTRIIKDNKATCLTKKTTFKNNIEETNAASVSDFINLTRHVEWYHTNSGSKKNVKDITCKKRKK
jgi:hypothetical protein